MTCTGVVVILMQVSEMPPILPKIIDWVLASTQVCAPIRYHVIYLKPDYAKSLLQDVNIHKWQATFVTSSTSIT